VRVVRGLALVIREFIVAVVGLVLVMVLLLGGIVLSLAADLFLWWFVKGYY
jgi:hypothetical protein